MADLSPQLPPRFYLSFRHSLTYFYPEGKQSQGSSGVVIIKLQRVLKHLKLSFQGMLIQNHLSSVFKFKLNLSDEKLL